MVFLQHQSVPSGSQSCRDSAPTLFLANCLTPPASLPPTSQPTRAEQGLP